MCEGMGWGEGPSGLDWKKHTLMHVVTQHAVQAHVRGVCGAVGLGLRRCMLVYVRSCMLPLTVPCARASRVVVPA